jgi:hypothetical protein
MAAAERMMRESTDRVERAVSGQSFLDPQLKTEPN